MESVHTSIEIMVPPSDDKISRKKTQRAINHKFGSSERSKEHRIISPHCEHHAEVPKKTDFLLTSANNLGNSHAREARRKKARSGC